MRLPPVSSPVATIALALATLAAAATVRAEAEAEPWTRARRAAVTRHDLPGRVRLVIGHEPAAPLSAVCRTGETSTCQVAPSARLEEMLRAPMGSTEELPPDAAPALASHAAALARLDRIALEGAVWNAEGATPTSVLSVATDLPPETVVALAERALGRAAPAPEKESHPRVLQQSSERLAVVTGDVTRPRIYTAWAFAAPNVDARAALDVAFDLAVQHERGRLAKLLLGRSLARTLGPVALAEEGALLRGLWVEPGDSTSVDRIRRFVDGTLKQLRLVGPTAGEVARAKARRALVDLHTWEDVELRARALGDLERSAGDAGRFLDLAEAVTRVTPESVRAAVAAHLVDARRTTLEVYPPGWLPDDPRMQKHRLYTIVQGDTLAAIATRFGVTVPALARANDLDPKRSLTPGDALWVPPR